MSWKNWPDLKFPPINLWNMYTIGKKEILSPCVGICTLDNNQYCIGCGRHMKEIANWTTMTNEEKFKIIMRIYESAER